MAGGGQVKFYPYKRRGEQKKVLAVLKGGGGTTRFEEVLTWELEVLALVIGGGGAKSFALSLRGEGTKGFVPIF